MGKNSLEGLLDAIMSSKPEVTVVGGPSRNKDYNVTISKTAQAMELANFAHDYRQRFEVGQYITPKANTGTRGVGLPHIVVETNYGTEPVFTQDVGSMRNGRRNEVRVACYVDDETITMFWVEAVDYEPWVKPDED